MTLVTHYCPDCERPIGGKAPVMPDRCYGNCDESKKRKSKRIEFTFKSDGPMSLPNMTEDGHFFSRSPFPQSDRDRFEVKVKDPNTGEVRTMSWPKPKIADVHVPPVKVDDPGSSLNALLIQIRATDRYREQRDILAELLSTIRDGYPEIEDMPGWEKAVESGALEGWV